MEGLLKDINLSFILVYSLKGKTTFLKIHKDLSVC